MDMEESSVPYRAFLRSGSYPALTQRVMRSGGVLAQAAGWFALVVTAASGGYNVTQRFVTPSAAAASQSLVRPAARPVRAGIAQPSPAAERVESAIVPDGSAGVDQRAHAASAVVVTDKGAASRKRTAAVAPIPAALPGVAAPSGAAAPELDQPAGSEQTAERALPVDTATPAAPEPAAAATAPDPIDAVLRDSAERQRADAQRARTPVREARMPARSSVEPAPAAPPAPSQPLLAAAHVDNVAVRGPLSAAQLRRSVDRVRPLLSECYGEAARRAGWNRFSQVRIAVTIDEAGRVKTQPKVEGAQLPGLEACLGGAMSKLVCQAPDTGTAKAMIVVGFRPER